jgi:hypothetical protein
MIKSHRGLSKPPNYFADVSKLHKPISLDPAATATTPIRDPYYNQH